MTTTAVATFLDALVDSLQAAAGYNRNAEIPPAAILWPDPTNEWEPLTPRVNELLPVLSLGPYSPRDRTGPATWLRCMLAGALEDARHGIAAVYLPGWTVRRLRAIAAYRHEHQPLAELQYRSAIWQQPDGQEWTIGAFLRRPDGGLGIPLHDSAETRAVTREAIADLAAQSVAELRANAPLKASDFRMMGRARPMEQTISIKELIAGGENDSVEFKETARYVAREGDSKGEGISPQVVEREIWKSVGGFFNSREGGRLLIGVADDGSIVGLERDYSVTKLSRKEQSARDAFMLWLNGMLTGKFGKRFVASYRVSIEKLDGKDICCIDVRPAPWPAWANEGKGDSGEVFYLRSSGATHKLSPSQAADYIRDRWPR